MGSDDAAPVDPAPRGKGVADLRVIDASVMPAIVPGNTYAATVMIAEKSADAVLDATGRRRSLSVEEA